MPRKKRAKGKKFPLGIVVIIAFIVSSILGVVFYQSNTVKKWDGLIYPGVKVEGKDLSGKTKDEAKIILEKQAAAIIKNKLNIVAPDKTYTLNYSDLNPKYNISEAVNQAFEYGKNLNLFNKYRAIKKAEGKELKLSFTYDSKPIDNLLAVMEKDIKVEPVNARIKGNSGNLEILPEQNGRKLEKDKLKKEIASKIGENKETTTTVKALVTVVPAKVSADKLSPVNSRIATFTTNYGSISSPERANNIILATKSIDGTILLPGDVFSFNDVVGERTAAKGYKAAPVIVGNQIDSGLGGGICQVSTTLYNAILRSNIDSVARAHHTLPSHYVPLGLDATVDYGNLDYKFKNTLDYPIYIEGSAYGGNITFNVYSNSSLNNTVTEINTEVYESIEPGVKYVDDPTLPVGQTQQVQAPYTGYKVKITKRVKQDGKVIKESVVANDFYKPVDAVIKRGTKSEVKIETKPEVKSETKSETKNEANSETKNQPKSESKQGT